MGIEETTLKVNLETSGPDFILTTPAQLIEAFTLWNKRFIESPAEWNAEAYFKDAEGAAVTAAAYLMELLRELNVSNQG